MKPVLYCLLSCVFFGFSLKAEEKSCLCVTGDSDSIFFRTGSIPWETATPGVHPYPESEYDSDGQRIKSLKWVKIPEGMTVSYRVIGRYHGQEIIDITYTSKIRNPDNPSAPFDYKVLAYRDGKTLRPFFILSGESTRWYEQTFDSVKGSPFLLHISVTMPGNGVFWSDYQFVFSDQSAWLSSRSQGGRKMKTKEETYNAEGKVLKTVVSEEN